MNWSFGNCYSNDCCSSISAFTQEFLSVWEHLSEILGRYYWPLSVLHSTCSNKKLYFLFINSFKDNSEMLNFPRIQRLLSPSSLFPEKSKMPNTKVDLAFGKVTRPFWLCHVAKACFHVWVHRTHTSSQNNRYTFPGRDAIMISWDSETEGQTWLSQCNCTQWRLVTFSNYSLSD